MEYILKYWPRKIKKTLYLPKIGIKKENYYIIL